MPNVYRCAAMGDVRASDSERDSAVSRLGTSMLASLIGGVQVRST
jgi:hypothetical protein